MRQEQESGTPLAGIYINLQDRSIEFEDEHGTIAKLIFFIIRNHIFSPHYHQCLGPYASSGTANSK